MKKVALASLLAIATSTLCAAPIALAQAFASTLMQRLHYADQHPLEDPRAVAGAIVARTVDHIR